MKNAEKIKRAGEFLDYGGSALFSQLLGDGAVSRQEALERLTELLKSYADVCPLIRGRSAAYRFMIKKAGRSGWLKSGYQNVGGSRLKHEERARTEEILGGYISSGGKAAKALKALIFGAVVIVVMALIAAATIAWFEKTIGWVKL